MLGLRLSAIVVVLAACGDQGVCIEGASASCTCTSGQAGAQVCNARGAFDACVCDGVEDTSDASDTGTPDETVTPDVVHDVAPCTGVGCGQCPTAVITCDEGEEVAPLTVIHCTAAASTAIDASVTRYTWSVHAPDGSEIFAQPSRSARDISVPTGRSFGSYDLSLVVVDSKGRVSCEPARHTVRVVSLTGFRVDVVWHTPGDADETDTGITASGDSVGSDVDLHVLHPYAKDFFDDTFDTYWLNPNPNWAGSSSSDDPVLERDDNDGGGPESVSLAQPENGKTYTVGVHYWDDWGYGPASVTVRVYIDNALRIEWAALALTNHDLWTAFEIDWPSREVRMVGGDGPQIEPDYQVPLGRGWPF